MADNYLERKFEEHQAASTKPTKRHTPTHERRAVVMGGACGTGAAIVRTLRVAGNKVSFCDTNDAMGAETALRNGAEYKHVESADADAYLQDVVGRWGGIDILVCCANVTNGTAQGGTAWMADRKTVEAAFVTTLAPTPQKNNDIAARIVTIAEATGKGPDEEYMVMAGSTAQKAAEMANRCTAVSCIMIGANAPLPTETAKMVRFMTDEGNNFLNGKCIDLR